MLFPRNSGTLNAWLAKPTHKDKEFKALIKSDKQVLPFELDSELDFDGIVYIQPPQDNRPSWANLLDELTGTQIAELSSKTSSAVLLIRTASNLFALTFGYGRFLIKPAFFAQDFGLKTALNTLSPDELKSVNLHTLDDQPIQKQTRTARNSHQNTFGIDIFKDILRSVTGSPREGIQLKNIRGSGPVFSFSTTHALDQLPGTLDEVASYYHKDDYKQAFAWVDNISKVSDPSTRTTLDQELLEAISNNDASIILTITDDIAWDNIVGYSFTRSKRTIHPVLDISNYHTARTPESVSLASIKKDQVFAFDEQGNTFSYSLYNCIYYESAKTDVTYILFDATWYEVDNSFIRRIENTLDEIQECSIPFPPINARKVGKKVRLESEADYNNRAAKALGFYLLDQQEIRSSKAVTPIELCDLLTPKKQLIHAKKRMHKSSGLSHLFAQGMVSAEAILGDKAFRKAARRKLLHLAPKAHDLIPVNKPQGSDYEVVYLLLGEETSMAKKNLPFFSKVSLSRTYDSLSQRGITVSIAGAAKADIEDEQAPD